MASQEAATELTARVPGYARAVLLMIGCSMTMSFSGLIVRSMQDADAWQLSRKKRGMAVNPAACTV